ncbi:MAG: hypothetical protein A3K10_17905 [Bacteroidetes bacterium RIFCSPLOWO2_12_FULL_31_6]|nr:MAG: hypothetical protein A3K10_17905 [Bacteroidetes bacterium RIFCSPLOWO2_12_FULL_31_6]
MFLSILIYIIFVFAFIIQLYFYLFVFRKLAYYKSSNASQNLNPVSVVICAKNEEKQLERNLPFFLQQNHPSFEIVIVNDASTDNTSTVLFNFQKQFKNLTIITLSPEQSCGKKNALTNGITASKYDHLLLTDADCTPKSKNWISKMSMNFTSKNDIILGYGAYEYRNGLLNELIRFDTIYIAIQYLSFALCGIPYMGVGRNLAYKKNLFTLNNGFDSHKNVMSGDDDLFISDVAKAENTVIEIEFEAQTISLPKENFSSWFYQKRRHLTTGVKYKTSIKLLLGLFQASLIAFYTSFIYIITVEHFILPIIILFLARTLIQIFTFRACFKKLGERHNFVLFPFYELFILFLNLILVISNLIYIPNSWQKN